MFKKLTKLLNVDITNTSSNVCSLSLHISNAKLYFVITITK